MGHETDPWAGRWMPIEKLSVNVAPDLLERLERITAPLRRISDSVRPLVESMKRLAEGINRSVEGWPRLARLGWTVPVWATPGEILDILEAEDDAAVDAHFVALYRSDGGERFRELVDDLRREPALAAWHTLIQQSADAYHRGDYQITVPALLTVLEGAAAHSVSRTGKMRQMLHTKVVEAESQLPGGVTVAMWRSVETFVERMFESVPFEGPRPQLINRHWILHGRDEATWTEADSLRLFQALHTLSDLAFDDQPKGVA